MIVRSIAGAAGLVLMAGVATTGEPGKEKGANSESAKSVYDFTMKDIDGNDVALARYKGNVVLIVNVASQ